MIHGFATYSVNPAGESIEMRTYVGLVAAALLMLQTAGHAQEKRDPALYKVEFNIRDGSATAAKPALHYTLLVEPNRKAVFKVGNRVPVATGSTPQGAALATQYTYLDIGVNIECTVSEMNGRIAMHGNLDLSTVVEHDAGSRTNPPNPTVGQTRLELDTAVEPGKPTVIASIEDPGNQRNFRVEATVTRAN
jgi:hypothetical protein